MAYPTLAQVKTRLGIPDTTEDTTITQILNGAIDTAEKHCGRVFVAANATINYDAVAPYVTKNKRVLHLFADLVSITTLTNGDGSVIASSDYRSWPFTTPYYEIELDRRSGLIFTDATQPISVAGDWGYSASCPDAIFQAILDLCHYVYFGTHSGSGGANMQASRQTGMIVAPDVIPPKIEAVLDLFRRR